MTAMRIAPKFSQQLSTCSKLSTIYWMCSLLLACRTPVAISANSLVPPPLLSTAAAQADCNKARASACGDPHFKGFDGRPFDFQGHAGNSYNLISEQEHQLNAMFVTEPESARTWLGDMVLKFKEDVVHMQVLNSGRLSVRVNQGSLNPPPGSLITRHALPSGTRLSLHHYNPGDPSSEERVILVTPSMSLAVRATGEQYHHLDLLILSISPYLCDVHGVLGQSYKRMRTIRAAIAAGNVIEGADWDYELPDLLSDSFTFNRFKLEDGGGCMGGASAKTTTSGSSTSSSSGEFRGSLLVEEEGAEVAQAAAGRVEGGSWNEGDSVRSIQAALQLALRIGRGSAVQE